MYALRPETNMYRNQFREDDIGEHICIVINNMEFLVNNSVFTTVYNSIVLKKSRS